MNNYEKIKAMSPEDMAEVIIAQDFCDMCEHYSKSFCSFVEKQEGEPLLNGCRAACLNWLKQGD